MAEKKQYRVYVSSTFDDLRDERESVLDALSRRGMESVSLESAPAGESAWETIKARIDASDYFLMLVGDRYGHLAPDGTGYVEREFDYATSQNKPCLTFVRDRSSPFSSKLILQEAERERLAAFKRKITRSALVKNFSNPLQLAVEVSINLRKFEAANKLNDAQSIVSLTIGSLIIPLKKVSEGTLVKSYADVWINISEQLGADWTLAFQIDPRKWEEILAGAFSRAGYKVILTPRSNDQGRDVIASKDGVGSVRILGSMKAYKPDHLVTREHVHEMLGVVSADQGATKGIITTTSDFAPKLLTDKGLARSVPYRLELMNGQQLQKWLTSLAK